MSIIEVNHLTKYYGKSRGIVDVSFNVEEGEIFGFIGPNGAGKTTLLNIISGLLSFSRHSGVEYKSMDLNEVLKQVLTLSQHKMEIQNIRLCVTLAPEPLIVEGDMNQLQQCFLNIIFNAIEAMPQGGELSLASEWNTGFDRALVTVRDTGCGISEGNLDHIFDPFFTTKQEGEGIGLGLSIVHGIVKAHKGTIKVESKVGEGTAFTLSFPGP